jgi:gliding motility-associated-like protein
LPEGENTLVVTNADGVTDTVYVKAACVTPEYVDISIPVGESDTVCLSTEELEGEVIAIFDPCLPGFDEPAELTLIDGTNCVEAFGMYIGQTGGCYVICDEYGICDTTYITVNVYDESFVALPDSLCTPKDVPIVGEVLNNDQLPDEVVSVNILTPPQHGSDVVNPDFTVTYVPDEGYCNDDENEPLDEFVYEVCNSFECQSAVVYVQVKCDGLIIYNGFSPNGDGVNDFFKIDGLENFENHNLIVYNRWGNKAFGSKNYNNDWDGFWDGLRLPVGTYFYLIELNNGEQLHSGYLQIWW